MEPSNEFKDGCPACGGEQLCPCKNCAPSNDGKVMWKWDKTGEIISCGHCGFTMHADGLMDLDMKRWDKRRAASADAP